MGSSKKAKTITPAAPETAKQVRTEESRFREDAQRLAAQKFGALGTDLTRGALAVDSGVKKKKLGGD